jgi:NTE family protein
MADGQKLKTALVLSAGGMFGAYQAGAYRVIAETFEPDLVVGASVGALNGWPIAGGCEPEALAARWLDSSTGEVLRLRGGWSLRDGCFDVNALRDHATRIYGEYRPRMPFGVVMTRLSGLKPCLVETPDVRAEHLQASASIPLVIPPVRIGGVLYTDGGLIEKLPVWAAIEMGATRIVAVDCLRVREWWVRLGLASWRVFKPRRTIPAGVEVTLIAPLAPLGLYREAVFWTRENASRWIELGTRDAARVLRNRP